jgi:hypothetical protein
MFPAKSISRGPGAFGRLHVPHLLAAVALVAGLLASPFATAPAHAVLNDLACAFTGQVTFTPPLTPSGSSSVTMTGNLQSCVSLNGNFPTLTSGSISGSGTISSGAGFIPCSPVLTIPLTAGVTWPGGQTSSMNLNLGTNPLDPSLNGTVTSGLLSGDLATAVPVVTPNLPGCLVNGLGSLQTVAGAVLFG